MVRLATFASMACLLLGLLTDAAQSCERADMRIVVDVGHTPQQSGVRSAHGKSEFSFNLALAKATADALIQRGFVKTRLLESSGIGSAQLFERTKHANMMKADLLISIHHDSVQDRYLKTWHPAGRPEKYSDNFSGYSLFVSRKNPHFSQSLALAKRVGEEFHARGMAFTRHHAEPIRGEGRTLIDDELGIYVFDELVVLRTSKAPALLIEAGIISNRADELHLAEPAIRAQTAQAVAMAVSDYCKAQAAPPTGAAAEPPYFGDTNKKQRPPPKRRL